MLRLEGDVELERKYARARASEVKFAEADVERLFGITVSKLRTAQRFKLVEPDYEVSSERRISRRWGVREIARVFVCNHISFHLSIPFIAAISVMKAWDAHKSYRREDTDERLNPSYQHPHIQLIDREHLSVNLLDDQLNVGKMEVGQDGRLRLETSGEHPIPSPNQPVSVCTVDLNPIRDRFLNLFDEITHRG